MWPEAACWLVGSALVFELEPLTALDSVMTVLAVDPPQGLAAGGEPKGLGWGGDAGSCMDSASTCVAFGRCCGWPPWSCVSTCAEACNSLARRQVAFGLRTSKLREKRLVVDADERFCYSFATADILCPFLCIVKR